MSRIKNQMAQLLRRDHDEPVPSASPSPSPLETPARVGALFQRLELRPPRGSHSNNLRHPRIDGLAGSPRSRAPTVSGQLAAGKAQEYQKDSTARDRPEFPGIDRLGFIKDGQLHFTVDADGLQSGGPVQYDEMKKLVENLGKKKGAVPWIGRGINGKCLATARKIFGSSLAEFAKGSDTNSTFSSVANALREAEPMVVRALPLSRGAGVEVKLGSNAMAVTAKIMEMQVGEHVYLPISRFGMDGHQLGASFSKLESKQFRVSFTNTLRNPPGKRVDVDAKKLLPALAKLLSGQFAESVEPDETHCTSGDTRLFDRWLSSIDPLQETTSIYFDVELRQPIQNGGSCGTESNFAFMATVLPTEHYKIAKAVCLNTMAEIGDHLIEKNQQILALTGKASSSESMQMQAKVDNNNLAPWVQRIRERQASAVKAHEAESLTRSNRSDLAPLASCQQRTQHAANDLSPH